jgi:hypothetical protein
MGTLVEPAKAKKGVRIQNRLRVKAIALEMRAVILQVPTRLPVLPLRAMVVREGKEMVVVVMKRTRTRASKEEEEMGGVKRKRKGVLEERRRRVNHPRAFHPVKRRDLVQPRIRSSRTRL